MNAPGSNPVVKGAIGTLYGQPIVTSALITTINTGADYAGALAVPDAIHWTTAPLPGQRDSYGVRLQANYMPEYLATLCTADILYGATENRDAAGIQIVSAVWFVAWGALLLSSPRHKANKRI